MNLATLQNLLGWMMNVCICMHVYRCQMKRAPAPAFFGGVAVRLARFCHELAAGCRCALALVRAHAVAGVLPLVAFLFFLCGTVALDQENAGVNIYYMYIHTHRHAYMQACMHAYIHAYRQAGRQTYMLTHNMI